MAEALAFLNGRFVPAAEAVLPVYDAGFVQGTTVAEQLRTFGGKLFRLEAHLQRLMHSLGIVGVEPGYTTTELAATAQELVARNHAVLAAGDDLGLAMFVTPGVYPTMVASPYPGPTVCMHTNPLPFHFWADKYRGGETLVTTHVQQVSSHCWPPELKCRSRMHYYLADRAAREINPRARAILCDADGFVTEATTANLLIYRRDAGLITPPRHKILPGISMATLADLAAKLEIPFLERDFTPADMLAADEVLLTSTSPCVLPVINVNGSPIGGGVVGPIHRRLLAAWSEHVGVEIVEQAARFARR